MAVLYPCHLSRRPFGSCVRKSRPHTIRHAVQWQAEAIKYSCAAPLARSTAPVAPEHWCTLVTQCSLDRWPRFAQQAGRSPLATRHVKNLARYHIQSITVQSGGVSAAVRQPAGGVPQLPQCCAACSASQSLRGSYISWSLSAG